MLTRAFALPDPASVTPLRGLCPQEHAEIARYRRVCEQLASCPALRHHGGIAINAGTDEIAYEPLPATRSMFEGLATRLRQLHTGSGGDPCFDSICAILRRHAELADDADRSERLRTLALWVDAREQLRERTLKNIVARRILRERQRDPGEANYEGFRPEEVIGMFDYGDLIARTARNSTATGVASDRAIADHLEHVFMVSILGLCHLYFGFAELAASVTADPDRAEQRSQ